MAEKQNVNNALAEARAELDRITKLQQEKEFLRESLLQSMDTVDMIFQRVSDIPAQVDADVASSTKDAELFEYIKQINAEELNDVEKKNRETAEKQASFLRAQEREYKRKAEELAGVQTECELVGHVLQQKKAKVADLQEQMDVETSLFVKQRVTLRQLKSKTKFDSAKYVDEYKTFQSDSAQLDEKFSAARTEITRLREGNTAMAEALAAVQSDNKSKSIELAALQSKAAAIKETCDREQEKQQKILSEFKIVEEQRKIEIDRMQKQLAEQRNTYENLKQVDADLSERIATRFGNSSKPMEQMIKEAKAEMSELKAVWLRLTESDEAITKSMDSNETKLKEIHDAKEEILEQLDRIWSPTHQQDVPIADDDSMDDSDDSDESEEEAQAAIIQPMDEADDSEDDDPASRPDAGPFHHGLPEHEAEEDQDVRVCSPDSSVSAWTDSVGPEEYANSGEHDSQRLELFAEHYVQ